MKTKFLIFQTLGVLMFIYFYFTQKHYFDIFIGDTIYNINYFYPVLLVLIIGNLFYLFKLIQQRNSNY